ncbi:MAG: hypothetical protein CMM61_07810 [Rhodospirillaceae bacterium]|nr:hypothetical protein [Rhodospirillaceae bacterium]
MAIDFQIDANGRMKLSAEDLARFAAMDPWQRHRIYHDVCQQAYAAAQASSDAPDTGRPLIEKGFEVVPQVLGAEDVAQIRGLLDDRVGQGEGRTESDGWAAPLPWNMARIHVLRQALEHVFNDTVTQALENYFQSYFRVMSLSVTRAFPAPARNSFLWHRDIEPPQQTHMMVYLTDSTEESGGTSFLDLDDSRAAAENGYSFKNLDDRLESLAGIEEKAGRTFKVNRPALRAGDSVLFAAPRILHRGELPRAGCRDAITILMLPSPVPWRDYLAGRPADVFVAQHPASAWINPFDDQNLVRTGGVIPPDWAHVCDMQPPSDGAY